MGVSQQWRSRCSLAGSSFFIKEIFDGCIPERLSSPHPSFFLIWPHTWDSSSPVWTWYFSCATHFRVETNFHLVRHRYLCGVWQWGSGCSEGWLSAPNQPSDGQMNFWHVRNSGWPTEALAESKPRAESPTTAFFFFFFTASGDKLDWKSSGRAQHW